MGGGGGSMESGEPEFQIAPMIDCLLVLLIFFMSITTASVLQIDKDITLPTAPDAKKAEKPTVQEGALNVKWKGQKGIFSFEGTEYPDSTDELVTRLKQRRETIAGYQLIVRGDRNLPGIEIQRTMNILALAGYADIRFSALNQ